MSMKEYAKYVDSMLVNLQYLPIPPPFFSLYLNVLILSAYQNTLIWL